MVFNYIANTNNIFVATHARMKIYIRVFVAKLMLVNYYANTNNLFIATNARMKNKYSCIRG